MGTALRGKNSPCSCKAALLDQLEALQDRNKCKVRGASAGVRIFKQKCKLCLRGDAYDVSRVEMGVRGLIRLVNVNIALK